jgi:hypothetical protein
LGGVVVLPLMVRGIEIEEPFRPFKAGHQIFNKRACEDYLFEDHRSKSSIATWILALRKYSSLGIPVELRKMSQTETVGHPLESFVGTILTLCS